MEKESNTDIALHNNHTIMEQICLQLMMQK